MKKVIKKTKNKEKDKSYENAYILTEIARILKKFGNEIENSVSLFDAIGEKNNFFLELEKNITSIDSMIKMNSISQKEIYMYTFKHMVNNLLKIKNKFNFIHIGKVKSNEIVFFMSIKDKETKELLLDLEFEYATSELSEYLGVTFCFLDSNKESDLINTEKFKLTDAN